MSSSSEELHDIDWEDVAACFDYTDTHLISPQHKAVIDNDLESLKKVLKSGRSPNNIDNSGNTPLHLSIINDRKDIFDYLLSVKDIRLDVGNFEDITPLMEAVTHKRDYYAIELIKCGIDLDYQQLDGNTALHLTVLENDTKVAVELLEHGADVNCQNLSGETPLHMAVKNINDDFFHILLYYGAITTIYDKEGFLPFCRCFPHWSDYLNNDGSSRCFPLYLQDFLFDMTFDNYIIKLKLSTLLTSTVRSSDMFYRILEKTSELIYSKSELGCLYGDLFQTKANKVKMLFLKFPKLLKDLRNPLCNCVHYLDSDDVGNTIELIYFFCENLNWRFVNLNTKGLIFQLILCQLPESTLSELVCTFLSCGYELSTKDLNMVYDIYGYGELFKILLHMTIEKYNWRNFMPMIIHDVQLISSFSGIPKVMDADDDDDDDDDVRIKRMRRRKISKFFTMDFGVVPSLLQLSRDVARKHLIKSYKIRDNVQFFTLLRWLPISKIYKAILSLEKEIYSTQNQPVEYSCTQ